MGAGKVTAPAKPDPLVPWRRAHAHACPNCGADEHAVSVSERWSRRGDLLCRECGYAVGACAAPCLREKGKKS